MDRNTTFAEALRDDMRRNDRWACLELLGRATGEASPEAVRALCDLLNPPRGPLRGDSWRWARREAALTLGKIRQPDTIPALVSALSDPYLDVRSGAREALVSFGSEAFPPLLAALQSCEDWTLDGMEALITTLGDIGDKRTAPALLAVLEGSMPPRSARWNRQIFLTPLYIVGGLGGVAGLIAFLAGLLSAGIPQALLVLFSMCLVGLIPAGILYALLVMFFFAPWGMIEQQGERHSLAMVAAAALGRLRDKRAISFLLKNSHFPRREPLRLALADLLPLINEEDTRLLGAEALRHLTDALNCLDSSLVLAVIKAMEYVGTGQAATPMERLTRRGGTPRIRAEAERVLPILQKRERREQDPTILLRASGQPVSPPDQLLRPAQAESTTPPEQLLRPGSF